MPVTLADRAARKIPTWLQDAVLYQIQPRAFTPEGTLAAATAKLPRLQWLGVTVIYLCPVFVADDDPDTNYWSERQKKSGFNNPRNPYRMKDFFHVDPEYGTDDDLRTFIQTAHRLKMRVMLDMVYLHCGPKPVFLADHPDFFTYDNEGQPINGGWAFPRLNYGSLALRDYLCSNLKYWVRNFSVDGFRCDVGDGVPIDFWMAARRRVEKIRPDVAFISEGQQPINHVEAFDCDYYFDWFSYVESVLDGRRATSSIVSNWCREVSFRPIGARRLLYSDNHDIANDDGLNRHETRWGAAANEAWLAANLLMDGVPMIYNGQEIADASRHSIFGRSPIDWSRQSDLVAESRFETLRALCTLRTQHLAFRRGKLEWLTLGNANHILAFRRTRTSWFHLDESFTVLINLSKTPETVAFPTGAIEASEAVLTRRASIQNGVVQLESWGWMVLSR